MFSGHIPTPQALTGHSLPSLEALVDGLGILVRPAYGLVGLLKGGAASSFSSLQLVELPLHTLDVLLVTEAFRWGELTGTSVLWLLRGTGGGTGVAREDR